MKKVMKKKITEIVMTTGILALCLSGCSGAEYIVELDCGNSLVTEQSVRSGKKLSSDVPVREGYVFEGWFRDEGLTQPWDVGKDKVKSDMTLYASWDRDTKDNISQNNTDKDFSKLRTPGSQEESYDYSTFFRPALDGDSQPYVGDTMPYYEDGTYYIYYLKEAGDSFNHSVYLAETQDFVTYKEYDEPVLESSRSGGQDSWIGTGSVVKVGETYYFFYTGHGDAATLEYKEKIMVAVGKTPYSFEKMEGWEITPPSSLGQKNDFRDPQAYFDSVTNTISLTVTASQANTARILKFTLDADLNNISYDGIIFTDPIGGFWNLECSDTFRIGDTYYITYSAQDDTLWYASSSEPFGPYGEPKRLDGKLFYAAKHVEDNENLYMAGWARRSESPSSTQDVSGWAGNLAVQKIIQKNDGSLVLAPVDAIVNKYTTRRPVIGDTTHINLSAGSLYSYEDAFTAYESFLISGEFTFSGEGSFGLAFDYSGRNDKNKLISICPKENNLKLLFNEGSTEITQLETPLNAGETYSFTYIQEGSAGIFYIDGQAAFTVRLYGVSGKTIRLFAENNNVLFTSLRQYTPAN